MADPALLRGVLLRGRVPDRRGRATQHAARRIPKHGSPGSTEIGQLAGYLLLDYDDQYRITQVGLYLARQGTAIAWHVPEFLRLLGTATSLPQLRGRLREYLRHYRVPDSRH